MSYIFDRWVKTAWTAVLGLSLDFVNTDGYVPIMCLGSMLFRVFVLCCQFTDLLPFASTCAFLGSLKVSSKAA